MNTGYTPWLPAWVPDWAMYVLASMLVLTAVGALIRAFFADRRRPQRSCPKCWYDMSRTTGLRCPECGKLARSPRQLQRPRVHRLRWTLAAVILLAAAAGSASLPTVRTGGWLALVPTRVLPWLLVFDDPQQHTIGRALITRFFPLRNWLVDSPWGLSISANEDQLAKVITRLAQGVPTVRPPSEAWTSTFGWTIDELKHQILWPPEPADPLMLDYFSRTPETVAALLNARNELLNLPYLVGELKPGTAWPIGAELLLPQLPVSNWWPDSHLMSTLTSISINGGPWSEPKRNRGIRSTDFTADAGTQNPLQVVVKVDVFREDRRTAISKLVGQEQRTVTIRLTASTEEAMTAVRDPRLDAIMAGSPAVVRYGRLRYDPTAAIAAAGGFDGVALALNLELCRDGKSIMTHRTYRIIGKPTDLWSRRFYPVTTSYVPESPAAESLSPAEAGADQRTATSSLAIKPLSPSSWTLRITPRPLQPQTLMEAERYWDGRLEIPVTFDP